MTDIHCQTRCRSSENLVGSIELLIVKNYFSFNTECLSLNSFILKKCITDITVFKNIICIFHKDILGSKRENIYMHVCV